MEINLNSLPHAIPASVARSVIDAAYDRLSLRQRWNYNAVHTYKTVDLLYIYATYALRAHRYYFDPEVTQLPSYAHLCEFVQDFEQATERGEDVESKLYLTVAEAIKSLLEASVSGTEEFKQNEVTKFILQLYSGLRSNNFALNSSYLSYHQRASHFSNARYEFDKRYAHYVQDNCNYYLLPRPDSIDEYIIAPKKNFYSVDLGENRTALSHFSSEVIKNFSTIIDFSQIKINLTPSNGLSQYPIPTGNDFVHISFGTSPSISTLPYSAGSIVGENFLSENCFNSFANKNDLVNVYTLESPFRGTPSLNKTTVKKKLLNSVIYIMPIVTNIGIFNFVTGQEESVPFIRIKIKADEKKIIKYKSSLNWMIDFICKITNQKGMEFYAPEEYEKLLKNRFGTAGKYYKTLVDFLSSLKIGLAEYKDNSFNTIIDALASDSFKYHEIASSAVDIPNLSEAIKNEKMLERLTGQLNELSNSFLSKNNEIDKLNASLSSFEDEIAYHLRRLENLKNDKETLILKSPILKKELSDIEKSRNALSEVIEPLNAKVKEFNTQKHEMLLASIDSADTKFLDNLSSSNMKLNNVYYTIPAIPYFKGMTRDFTKYFKLPIEKLPSGLIGCSGYREDYMISIQSLPKIAYCAQNKLPLSMEDVLTEEGIVKLNLFRPEEISFALTPSLIAVDFSTLKPSIIKIDGTQKSVVGGPYNVILFAVINFDWHRRVTSSTNYMYISAKESSSVVGIDKDYNDTTYLKIKIHPHTGGIYAPKSENFFSCLKGKYDYCCLGEGLPGIYKGFELANVRMALFSAKAWIESTNSGDTWGRTYTMFPALSEVNLNGIEVEETEAPVETNEVSTEEEITDTEMLMILQGVIDNINTTLSTTPVEQPVVFIDLTQPELQQTVENIVEAINESLSLPPIPPIVVAEPTPVVSNTGYSTYSSVVNSLIA
jgi:hypothetical protein